MTTTRSITRQGQRPAPGTIRQQVDEQERVRLRLQGPRSNFLAHFGGRHHPTGSIHLRTVEELLIADRCDLDPTIIGPFAPYDVITIPAASIQAAQMIPGLTDVIEDASDALATLLTSSSDTTGNLGEYLEGVVASFSRIGLLFIANALNRHYAPLLPDLPAAAFKRPGVISPSSAPVAFEVEFNYKMGEPANIRGRADSVLLRRTQVAAPQTAVVPPATQAGNFYVPLCILEVKHVGDDLLDAGLAACLVEAALLGHKYNLSSVVGVVTNLQQWRFLRVEAGRQGVFSVSNVQTLGFVNHPVRDPFYTQGSLDHIVSIITFLCTGTPFP